MDTIVTPVTVITLDSTRIVHSIKADLVARYFPPVVRLVQYDQSLPVIAVSLMQNGQAYTLPSGAAANIRVHKPDATYVYNPALGCDSTRNIVYFEVTQAMAAANGDGLAIVEIVVDGDIAGTSLITLHFEENPVPEDAIESSDEWETIYELGERIIASTVTPVSTAAGMTDHNVVYLYTGTESGWNQGHMYYYNGTTWVDAGIAVTDTTLSVAGLAADAKKTGDEIATLKDGLNKIEDITFFVSDTEETSVQTASGWRLNESDGLCAQNANYKLVKINAVAGTYLRITTDDRFQFQNSPSVPSTGTSNRIGKTYQAGTYYVLVPSGATFLIVSTLISDGNISVKKSEPIIKTVSVIPELQDDLNDAQTEIKSMSLEEVITYGASVTTFDLWQAGGRAHNGYRMPICGGLTFKRIEFNTVVSANTNVTVSILDNALNVLATKTISASTNDTRIIVTFDSAVTVPNNFGFVEILCSDAKIGYNNANATIDNTSVFPTPTTENRGYFNDNGSSWARLTVSQTYTFHVPFKLYKEGMEYLESTAHNSISVSTAQQLVDTLTDIATSKENNKASKNNQYDIYLSSGTYELYSVIDKTDLTDQVPFKRGLEIPDYVNLIGVGDVTISCTVPDEDNTDALNITRIVSTINTYGENVFKNLKIIANNCRYCVHDDDGSGQKDRSITFEDCTLIHNGITTPSRWSSPECYGAGYTGGRKGIFNRCVFKSLTYIPFYIHNSPALYMSNIITVDIKSCAFITNNNVAMDFEEAYGTLAGNISVVGCSINGAIRLRGTNKWTLFGGGNGNVTIDNQNESTNYLV